MYFYNDLWAYNHFPIFKYFLNSFFFKGQKNNILKFGPRSIRTAEHVKKDKLTTFKNFQGLNKPQSIF